MGMIPRMAHLLKGSASRLPSLNLSFLSGVLDPRITFSRGTQATLTDGTGKITYAPNNLVTNSVLAGATGGVIGSGAVAPTGWSFPAGTGSASFPTAVYGGGTAVRTVASAQRPFVQSPSVSVNASTSYIFSAYVEAVSSGTPNLQDIINFNSTPAGSTSAWYVNGVLVASPGTYLVSAGQRVSILFAIGATAGSISVRLGMGGQSSATGDITMSSPQFEQVTYQTTPSTYNATTSSAYYGPRFDYDPVTLAAKGLLIEEARTNLLLYSTQFDNAYWTTSVAGTGVAPVVTANAGIAPDGTMTADQVVFNSGSGTTSGDRSILGSTTAAVTAAATYTTSIYVKGVAGTKLLMRGVAGNAYATLTLTGGWDRFSTAEVAASTTGALEIGIRQGVNGTINSTATVYLWGAQLEAGAFATSYIPTIASTVTRSADVATMTGTNFSSWYNASAGTFVTSADSYAEQAGVNAYNAISANDGTTNNYIRQFFYATTAGTTVRTGAVNQADLSGGTWVRNVPLSNATAYAANDFAGAINGALTNLDTSGTVPTVDRFSIGANTTHGSQLNGHLRTIAYYNSRLPDATLKRLTS